MSYSRWGQSMWYTFWNSASSGKFKDDQVLSLWYSFDAIVDWPYSELLNITVKDIQRRYECEIEEAEEAIIYINKFIKDVNREFGDVK